MKKFLISSIVMCALFLTISPSFADECDDEPILTEPNGCEWTDCGNAFIVECPEEPVVVVVG